MAMPPNLQSLYMGGMYPPGVQCRESASICMKGQSVVTPTAN